MHSISWNPKAVEQAKAQGFDNPKNATCPSCRHAASPTAIKALRMRVRRTAGR